MKRACVIGWPVSHSLSPVLHGYWLAEHKIDGEYLRQAVEPAHLPQFIKSLGSLGFSGANVTLPHKIEAYRLCDRLDEAARAIGAVNTLWFEDGQLCGSNTDAEGFIAILDQAAPGWDAMSRRAVVIGAGGAARAVVWALGQQGFEDIRIVNRTLERAMDLARDFPPATAISFDDMDCALQDASLVVNTSSLGMTGTEPLRIDLSPVALQATVCDIVYQPLETELLKQARDKQLRAVDGLGMLLHQAVPGFERWFGVRPVVTTALRDAVLEAIAARKRTAS